MGCEELPDVDGNIPSGAAGMQGTTASKKNYHPTVKPIKLMEYLCNITRTPTGGLVLDPFAGSGSTLIACKLNNRDSAGFEISKDYFEIAEKRIKGVKATRRLGN
jgi:site-specific DNA-methyltransferase (adenine-specific)